MGKLKKMSPEKIEATKNGNGRGKKSKKKFGFFNNIALQGPLSNYHTVRFDPSNEKSFHENHEERFHEQKIVGMLTNTRHTEATDIGENLAKKSEREFWWKEKPQADDIHEYNMKERHLEHERRKKLQQDIDDGIYHYGPGGHLVFNQKKYDERENKRRESKIRDDEINRRSQKKLNKHLKNQSRVLRNGLWLENSRDEYFNKLRQKEAKKYDKKQSKKLKKMKKKK